MEKSDWRLRLSSGRNRIGNRPSTRKPKYTRKVPPGCVDVWRVTQFDGRRFIVIDVFLDEALAYQEADDLHMKCNSYVQVEHKAAVQLGDRAYIVNLDPLYIDLPRNDSAEEQLNPSVRAPAQLPALLRSPEVP